jgi:hypothetical protein
MFCYRERMGGEKIAITTYFQLCEKEGGTKFFALGGTLLSRTDAQAAKINLAPGCDSTNSTKKKSDSNHGLPQMNTDRTIEFKSS